MKINLENIPTKPGVYFFKDKMGKLLYIGKAKNLRNRLSQYFTASSVWKQDMVAQAAHLDFVTVGSESEALILEINLINKHRPPYNNLLKGDSSYVYLKITNEDFPQLVFTRYRQNDGGTYIGPKLYRYDLKKLLELVRLILKFRGCKTTQFRKGQLTSDFFFGMCEGRCIYNQLKIPKQEVVIKDPFEKNTVKLAISQGFKANYSYEEAKKEYKRRLNMIIGFFRGDGKSLEKEILDQMNIAVEKQHFEYAAKIRDVYLSLKKFVEKQNVILPEVFNGYFFKIKIVGEYHVYCIMYFYEGKLIDIIRFKEKDTTYEEMIDEFEAEFGEFKLIEENFGYSKEIQKLSKNTINEIDNLAENFIESLVISSSFEKENLMNERLKGLQEKYSLKNYPYRIECIDISHLGGGWISGGLSCQIGGILHKKGYRQYKIKSVKKQAMYSDDYLSLLEVIQRRFNLTKKMDPRSGEEVELPELFIIDGGKGQLGVVQQIYENYPKFQEIFEKVDFISIGKGAARKTQGKIKGEKEKVMILNKKLEIEEFEMDYDDIDRILITSRDEAHRFSNRYRKKQMSMEFR